MSEDNIKEKIIQAAISLIREDSTNITVRKIAAQAGITQGLINYHFQTKNKLVDIAAQRIVDETITKMPDRLMQMDGAPIDKLRISMKGTMRYLFGHPNVSRISIMRDLQTGHSKDNMQSSIDAYDILLKKIITDDRKRFLAGHTFSAAMQSLFLRAGVLIDTQNIDVSDPAIQSQFIDDLVDMVLGGLLTSKESAEYDFDK